MLKKIYSHIENELKSAKVRDFEVYYEKQVDRSYEVKDAAIESAEEAVSVGIALRIFRDDRVSFSYSTDLSEKGLGSLIQAALQTLPLQDPGADQQLFEGQTLPALDLENFDSTLDSVPVPEKIALALTVERTAKGLDPRIRHVRNAGYNEEILTSALLNSRGLECSHTRSVCSLGVMAVAEENSEAECAYEFAFSPKFSQLEAERVGKESARRALSYLGSTTPSTRTVPVVLDPLVAAEILGVLAGSFQGDEVFKKRSYLEGKLNQAVYSPLLQITDNALLVGGIASSPFDGEGLPRQKNVLVEKGVLKSLLLDTDFARKLGMKSNAASTRRGIKRPPFISHSNLFIEKGLLSDEEIYRQVRNGILVTEAIGMHTANPITGDFSIGAQGFLIENGEKSQPVKKVTIAGNLHQMMNSILAVGIRHRYNYAVGAPSLAIGEMTVSGG